MIHDPINPVILPRHGRSKLSLKKLTEELCGASNELEGGLAFGDFLTLKDVTNTGAAIFGELSSWVLGAALLG